MRRKTQIIRQWLFVAAIMAAMPSAFAYDNEKLKFIAQSHAANKIAQIASDPEVIKAVVEQNRINNDLTKSEIVALDRRWVSNDTTLVKKVLGKPLSKDLQRIVDKSFGKYTEIIVMDNKGVNVAQNMLTTDYWQGDEEKFIEAFKGKIHVENVEYDDSSETFELFASVPIRLADHVIGVIAVGMNPEAMR